jgi:hypothetical protein
VIDYWWCFQDDNDDDGDCGEKGAYIESYGVDMNWYSDTGATNHINKLSTYDKYNEHDRVRTAKGICTLSFDFAYPT